MTYYIIYIVVYLYKVCKYLHILNVYTVVPDNEKLSTQKCPYEAGGLIRRVHLVKNGHLGYFVVVL